MYVIGLTGGIACGKSAISEILRKYGAVTLDVDKITHKLLEPGEKLFDAYVRHFGKYILKDDGTLNKKMVGEIIFNNPDERLWINETAHPILWNYVRDFLIECQAAGKKLVVPEVPLIFEGGGEKEVDEVWAVSVRKKIQLRRLMHRDKISRQQAKARLNSQMSQKEICSRSDLVIKNERPKKAIEKEIVAVLRKKNLI